MPEEFRSYLVERINVSVRRAKRSDVIRYRDGAFDRAARFILPLKFSRLNIEGAHGAGLAAKINAITRDCRWRQEFFVVLIAPKYASGSLVESVDMPVRTRPE